MERAWAYGTAIININIPLMNDQSLKEFEIERKEYTIEEIKNWLRQKIFYLITQSQGLKKPGTKEQRLAGASALARTLGMFMADGKPNYVYIMDYVQCLYLEPETQAMIGRKKGEIPYAELGVSD